MPKQSLSKILFGGILSLVSLLNQYFGWFRAFHWLKTNAPPVWGVLVSPPFEYTLICIGVVLSAVGLWEIWQFKRDSKQVAPESAGLTGSTATGDHSQAVTSYNQSGGTTVGKVVFERREPTVSVEFLGSRHVDLEFHEWVFRVTLSHKVTELSIIITSADPLIAVNAEPETPRGVVSATKNQDGSVWRFQDAYGSYIVKALAGRNQPTISCDLTE